jgi:hypothetical protein
MNPGRPQATGALLAGGAAVLLIASLFLRWYTLDLPARVRVAGVDLPSFTGFEALERADVAIVVAAGLAILIAGWVVVGLSANSTAAGIALVVLGLFAFAVVLYRGVISPPGFVLLGVDLDMNVSFGWFVSLAMTVLVVVGGALTYLAGERPTILTRRDG